MSGYNGCQRVHCMMGECGVRHGDRGVCKPNKELAVQHCVLTTEDMERKGERNDVKGHFCQDVKT
jgi:hypothetical protein